MIDREDIPPNIVHLHKELIAIQNETRKKDYIPPNYATMFFGTCILFVSMFIARHAYEQIVKLIITLHEADNVLLEELLFIIKTNDQPTEQTMAQTIMNKLLHSLGGPSRMPTIEDIQLATNNIITHHLLGHAKNEYDNIISQCGWERTPHRTDYANVFSFRTAQAITATKNLFSGIGPVTCIGQVTGIKMSKTINDFMMGSRVLTSTVVGQMSAIWSCIYYIFFLIPSGVGMLVKSCGRNPTVDIALRMYRDDN